MKYAQQSRSCMPSWGLSSKTVRAARTCCKTYSCPSYWRQLRTWIFKSGGCDHMASQPCAQASQALSGINHIYARTHTAAGACYCTPADHAGAFMLPQTPSCKGELAMHISGLIISQRASKTGYSYMCFLVWRGIDTPSHVLQCSRAPGQQPSCGHIAHHQLFYTPACHTLQLVCSAFTLGLFSAVRLPHSEPLLVQAYDLCSCRKRSLDA